MAKYPLPGGDNYPALKLVADSGEGIVYMERYAAASMARAYAVCSYLNYWLNAPDKAVPEAVTVLDRLEKLNADPEAIPESNSLVAHTATVIKAVRLGDPSSAREYVGLNCAKK